MKYRKNEKSSDWNLNHVPILHNNIGESPSIKNTFDVKKYNVIFYPYWMVSKIQWTGKSIFDWFIKIFLRFENIEWGFKSFYANLNCSLKENKKFKVFLFTRRLHRLISNISKLIQLVELPNSNSTNFVAKPNLSKSFPIFKIFRKLFPCSFIAFLSSRSFLLCNLEIFSTMENKMENVKSRKILTVIKVMMHEIAHR